VNPVHEDLWPYVRHRVMTDDGQHRTNEVEMSAPTIVVVTPNSVTP